MIVCRESSVANPLLYETGCGLLRFCIAVNDPQKEKFHAFFFC